MNLLITGAWQQGKDYIDYLEQLGHKVHFMQFEKDKLPCEPSWVEGIIGNGIFLSHSIEKFTHLCYIQLTSAGYDRAPMEFIKSHGIKIYNARGVYSIPMAEHVIWAILSLYRKQGFFFKNQEEHKWEKFRNIQELCGKTVCVFGCGSVGVECAKRFEAMGCIVYGVNSTVCERQGFYRIYNVENSKKILSISDIVIITLPLTMQTKHMFNREMFSSMKKGSVVVNVSRGGGNCN